MATVLGSTALLRTQVAYLLFAIAELASWVAILVYAYDQGGATAAGLVAFVQLAPAVVFAPVAATIGERLPRTRLLAIAYLAIGLANLALAALLLTGQPPLSVYLGAVVAGLAITGTAGPRTLQFTSAGLTAVSSASIALTAGVPTQMAVSAGKSAARPI